jgi:hypothetical protein
MVEEGKEGKRNQDREKMKAEEKRREQKIVRTELKKLNSVAVVRKRTIPTERPPLVGEVSANPGTEMFLKYKYGHSFQFARL